MRPMDAHELARINRLEQQVAYLLRHLGLDADAGTGPAFGAASGSAFGSEPASAFGSPADIFGAAAVSPPGAPPAAAAPAPAYPAGLEAALDRGRMIEAIKIYREWSGVGLAEAKAAVEQISRQRR
jgi:hypothetical protein